MDWILLVQGKIQHRWLVDMVANGTLDSIKGREFLDQLCNYQLLMEDSAP
jgi:hypothetical protein